MLPEMHVPSAAMAAQPFGVLTSTEEIDEQQHYHLSATSTQDYWHAQNIPSCIGTLQHCMHMQEEGLTRLVLGRQESDLSNGEASHHLPALLQAGELHSLVMPFQEHGCLENIIEDHALGVRHCMLLCYSNVQMLPSARTPVFACMLMCLYVMSALQCANCSAMIAASLGICHFYSIDACLSNTCRSLHADVVPWCW